MKGSWHYIIGIVVFTILWLVIDEIKLTMIFIPIALSLFPDADLKLNSHRNFLFHSVILWLVVFIFNPSLMMALVCLSIGIHCISDITLIPSAWKGFYTLKLVGNRPFFMFIKGCRGLLTTLWLLVNFIISVIIVVIALWVW